MKTFLTFLTPYKWLCLLTILVTLFDVGGALFIPTLTAEMINIGVSTQNMDLILQKSALMLAAALIAGLATLAGSWLCAKISSQIGRDIRNALYDKTLNFSTADFERFGTGSMITRTLNDINIIQIAFVWTIQMVLPVPIICILGSIMALRIDRHMGMMLIGVMILVLLAALFITKKAAVIFNSLQKFLDRINIVLRENITGVRVIRAFNKERSEEDRMRKAFEDYAISSIRANRLFAGLESLAMVMINCCIVAILWQGADRVGAGYMEIGDITALTEYAILILFYVVMSQMVVMMLPRAIVCIRRINEVLEHQPEITDSLPDPNTNPKYDPNSDPKSEVCRFQNVDFRYKNADEATLENLDFSCKTGETTAIIGSTGSGKSTIINLLLRFHDPSSGTITLHNRDIRNIPQQELRRRIAYVPQKSWLFSGNIAENLRYGAPDATDAELWQALDIAQAQFVRELPLGLASPVSQGGSNLSGGQKQRLAIARALLRKDADIFIFDDSFSALDFRTEAALRHALAEYTQNAAVIIIGQRINSIRHADQIIVLDDGRITGIGHHHDLLQTCPIYREIAESQAKGGAIND